MKNNIHCSFFILLAFLLSGCSAISGKLSIIEGNYYNARGMYDKAIASYYKALEYPEAAAYAEFGLGTVYYSIGEAEASLSRFSEALNVIESSSAEQKELLYRIHYNTGVALFSEGDFSGAADSFRKSLKASEKKFDAKRNLELSLLSHERQNPARDASQNSGGNSGKAALFEYIFQKELGQWKNRDWPEEETTGPDY